MSWYGGRDLCRQASSAWSLAENLDGHISEQTGKEYAAGARHRPVAPFFELLGSVGNCQFPDAMGGKHSTQEHERANSAIRLWATRTIADQQCLHLRAAGKFGELALEVREQSVATASGHDTPEVGALLRHAAD
jgi:hypothetical protein